MVEVRGVAVPWYYEADYVKVLGIMIDGDRFPKSYREWLDKSESKLKALEGKGTSIERVYLNPDEFVFWCSERGVKTDTVSRQRYAAEIGAMRYKNQS